MSLETFLKDKNEPDVNRKEEEKKDNPVAAIQQVQTEPQDYAFNEKEGYVITPRGNRFPIAQKRNRVKAVEKTRTEKIFEQFPRISRWLHGVSSSRETWRLYARSTIDFCIAEDITPEEFTELRYDDKQQDKAIDIASNYIQQLILDKRISKAEDTIKALTSFYRYFSKGRRMLALDTEGALKIKQERKRTKERKRYAWGTAEQMRKSMTQIISHARNLYDQTAITFLSRTGIRDNVLTHLKVKHTQDRFKIENGEGKKEEVLCLTVNGYNPDTKEGLCSKTFHYNFPRLPDDPKGRHGYYTFLARDSLELFDSFMTKYHPNPDPEDYVFYHMRYGKVVNRKEPLTICLLRERFKQCAETIGIPGDKVWLHQLKEVATTIIEAGLTRENSFRAEFLTGHVLKGARESYHKRNKIADGQAYLKARFTPEEAKDEEIERLKKELAETRMAKEEVKEEEKTEEPTVVDEWQKQYENDVNGKQPKKEFPSIPMHPHENKEATRIREKATENNLLWCPDKDEWINKATCDICKTKRFNVFKSCNEMRLENPNSPLFKPSKPRPNR